jgi:C4-dicarboxylate-specific signal transduction histidine kinase
VLSAYTDVEYLIDAINRGEVYRYITKPWAPSDLKITVKKALEHYQAMVDRRELVEILLKKNLELNSKNETLQKTLRDLESAQQKILQMERLSIIGRMGGMIIHDLKQPLDIIRSAAETMNSYELKDQERSEITQMIKYEVDRFFDMIHELLDYTKGKISWDLEHIKLSDFWSVTESRIRNYVRSYDVGLRFYPVDEDALLFVDRHRLQRAFINLVKNAVDAFRNNPEIEAPEIAFRVGVSRDKVIFEVADNGPGVNSEIKGEIFSPFVSGNKEFGVGLGLTIVQYIIRELGGEIKYRENSPQGSIFTITLLKSEAPVEGEA